MPADDPTTHLLGNLTVPTGTGRQSPHKENRQQSLSVSASQPSRSDHQLALVSEVSIFTTADLMQTQSKTRFQLSVTYNTGAHCLKPPLFPQRTVGNKAQLPVIQPSATSVADSKAKQPNQLQSL